MLRSRLGAASHGERTRRPSESEKRIPPRSLVQNLGDKQRNAGASVSVDNGQREGSRKRRITPSCHQRGVLGVGDGKGHFVRSKCRYRGKIRAAGKRVQLREA